MLANLTTRITMGAILVLLCHIAQAQTSMGPIRTPQVNQNVYVGQSGYPTIQSAVTYACRTGNRSFAVVIQSGMTPSDTIAGVTGGCSGTYIDDYRTATVVRYNWTGTSYAPNGSGSGSPRVVYASQLPGVHPGVNVLPGASATGQQDSLAAIQAPINGGNVWLEVDSGFALSGGLRIPSNTVIHCTARNFGFILLPAANDYVLVNSNPQPPNISNGGNGYVVSNQANKSIKIEGCMLNANSVQSATGSLCRTGVSALACLPHTSRPDGIEAVPGLLLTGIDELTVDGNEVYDTPTFGILLSNDSNVHIDRNFIHQPVPIVWAKNTDGLDILGPSQWVWVSGNRANGSDDSFAIGADTFVATPPIFAPSVLRGNVTDVLLDNNSCDSGTMCVRLNSSSNAIDRVTISHTSGKICGYSFQSIPDTLETPQPPGNIGSVVVDGWQVQSDATCSAWGSYLFNIGGNINSFEIRGLQQNNPPSGYSLIQINSPGTIKTLTLDDWTLNTQTSSFTSALQFISGTVSQLNVNNINWNDSVGSATFISGTASPAIFTCSNFSLPARISGAGFTPTVHHGDCFGPVALSAREARRCHAGEMWNDQQYLYVCVRDGQAKRTSLTLY